MPDSAFSGLSSGHAARCSRCARRATRRGLCHAHYEQYRTRQHAYGRWESVYVDAASVRRHVRALLDAGLSLRRIHDLAIVDRKTLHWLMVGRPERGTGPSRSIRADTARRLLQVTVPTRADQAVAPGTAVSAVGTTRRLQALVALGHSQAYLCQRLGIRPANAAPLFSGDRSAVRAQTARNVAALFDELQMVQGRDEAGRRRATQLGWAPPLASDENRIDDAAVPPTPAHSGGFALTRPTPNCANWATATTRSPHGSVSPRTHCSVSWPGTDWARWRHD